ncbi:MAG: hypothetical protein L3J62_03105 [Gammaproteobacteria bacterium]|nr:hypothetical protein [Gammaproteobacteria bacterium]
MSFEPPSSIFAVDTAVEKSIPSFTHPRLLGVNVAEYAIALSCVKCEEGGSLV